MDNPIKKVHVISHFHWDREWYQDFQGFRLRLVYAIDELLDRLEQDHEYRHFTMDGQTIVIDDYLEIRPENRARLLKLIQQQRISIGPWYVMPDEFLVSGEALIRNLLTGFRRARACGVEPLKCGYVTDIFGHNSQLPQIMQGFGIGHALLFRGFKGGADRGEIWWEGADGSRLLALKLDEDRAYSDFFFFIRWPFTGREPAYPRTGLVERAAGMLKYKAERNAAGTVATFDGVDHIEIEAQLPWLLKTLNLAEELNGTEFVHSTLPVFFKELEESQVDMPVFYGEQRTPSFNGVCNALLANVLSSRVKLKQRNQQCETALVNWTEPWSVFAGREGKPYPSRMLQKAWEFLMQNHPHDSICGCSIDQDHRQVLPQVHAFSQPLRAVQTGLHAGSLPAINSWAGLDNPEVAVSSLKKADTFEGLTLRICNLSEAEQPVTLEGALFNPARTTIPALINEKPTGPALSKQAEGVQLTVPGKKIVTLRLPSNG